MQPTFFSAAEHFALYHPGEGDLVAVFEIVECKPIRIERTPRGSPSGC
jgi:hypothetical protein